MHLVRLLTPDQAIGVTKAALSRRLTSDRICPWVSTDESLRPRACKNGVEILMSKALLALLLPLLTLPYPLSASERAIDSTHSRITIHVGKAGLLSAAGHEHEVSAPIAEGAIYDSEASHVWLRVVAARMTVLPEKDQEAVRSTMQKGVLESDKFP